LRAALRALRVLLRWARLGRGALCSRRGQKMAWEEWDRRRILRSDVWFEWGLDAERRGYRSSYRRCGFKGLVPKCDLVYLPHEGRHVSVPRVPTHLWDGWEWSPNPESHACDRECDDRPAVQFDPYDSDDDPYGSYGDSGLPPPEEWWAGDRSSTGVP
jgi:hypothetical protein